MDTIHERVSGLDIHKTFIMCCVRKKGSDGKFKEEIQRFGTMTHELLELAEWLKSNEVTHVAMESTAVLWKPVWNILDAYDFNLLLINAKELKQVPGRKSDVKDSQWIAQLLSCGLLKSSFVPSRAQRDLRDLTRHRAQLNGERTRCINRIHKILQDANIKLSSVATDILGVSGRDMLDALATGQQDPQALSKLARGKLRKKIPQLNKALQGHVTEHHRFMLQQLLEHLAMLETQVEHFDSRIEETLAPFVDEGEIERLSQIPGIARHSVEDIIAEIGVDMSVFPTAGHLASWAGICPGNEESAGKRKRSKTTSGNVWLRRALSQSAWGATKTKDTYFAAQYRRLASRRGKKRAIVAVAHSLLEVIYHLLSDKKLKYKELGGNYFDSLEPARLQRHLIRRLEKLGFDVTLTHKAA